MLYPLPFGIMTAPKLFCIMLRRFIHEKRRSQNTFTRRLSKTLTRRQQKSKRKRICNMFDRHLHPFNRSHYLLCLYFRLFLRALLIHSFVQWPSKMPDPCSLAKHNHNGSSLLHSHDFLQELSLKSLFEMVITLAWSRVMASESLLARRFLCILLSSAPSERVWSGFGHVIDRTSTTIDSTLAAQIMFLRANQDLLDRIPLS